MAKKNDQCYVEQKNGAIVPQYVGYDRFEGERAYRQLVELYRALRLYINFFQPSMKLLSKERNGTIASNRVRRKYEPAQTPLQRLLATYRLTADADARLHAVYRSLDPVRLLQQIMVLQDALWRLAVLLASTSTTPGTTTAPGQPTPSTTPDTRVNRAACGLGSVRTDEEAVSASAQASEPVSSAEHKARRDHRTKLPLAPHTWRTRLDPFATVRAEVCGWLEADPARTALSVLQELQERYPDQYPDSLLRTTQRRVHAWRAQSILIFDDQWLQEDSLPDSGLPRPLQATTAR